MSEAKVPTERGAQRICHLLMVARAEFVAHGFDAVSIDWIARAAHVSKDTIYRHFADKEALFRAALDAAGAEFTARTEAVHRVAGHPRIELAGLARAILDAAVDQGMFNALWVAASISQRMPDLSASLQDGQSLRMEPVRQALQNYASQQGSARPVPLEVALDFGTLAVEGPAVLMGFAPPPVARRNLIAEQVALLFSRGISGVIEAEGGDVALSFVMPEEIPEDIPDHIRTLLGVATRHFKERGYAAAKLDLISAEARVGRGTLYRHFGNKAGLFAGALRWMAHENVAHDVPPLPHGIADRAALEAFLEAAIKSLASPPSLDVHRLAIDQSRRAADVARAVYAILRVPWVDALARWLAGLGLRNDPGWHARQLLVLAMRGNRLIAGAQPVSADARRRYARRAAAIYLDGFIGIL